MTACLRGTLRAAFPALIALAVLAGAAQAQIRSDARTHTQTRPLTATAFSAHATISALALRLRSGSADDPRDAEGTAWLLADVLVAQANAMLAPLQSTLTVQVDRGTTVYTLVAPPELFDAARAVMDSVLFRAPIEPLVLQARRTALLGELAFETDSPVADFDREAETILADPGSTFTRPPRGTPSTVVALDGQTLERYRSTFYRRQSAALATVLPTPPSATAGGDSMRSARAPEAEPMVAENPVAPDTPVTDTITPDIAWHTGMRQDLARDVTSTWITIAYPAPTNLPRTQLELLAFTLDEELDPTLPDPDRYGVSARIEDTPHGAVLLVEATVFPDAADRWETKITAALTDLSSTTQSSEFFAWRRRRFRAHRLIEDSAPEARAARLTSDLLRAGAPRDLDAETWQLDAKALRDAARALGEPRIFRYGPELRGASRGAGVG